MDSSKSVKAWWLKMNLPFFFWVIQYLLLDMYRKCIILYYFYFDRLHVFVLRKIYHVNDENWEKTLVKFVNKKSHEKNVSSYYQYQCQHLSFASSSLLLRRRTQRWPLQRWQQLAQLPQWQLLSCCCFLQTPHFHVEQNVNDIVLKIWNPKRPARKVELYTLF